MNSGVWSELAEVTGNETNLVSPDSGLWIVRLTKSDSIIENIDIDVLILTRDRDNIASERYSYSAGVTVALLRPLWKLGEGVEGVVKGGGAIPCAVEAYAKRGPCANTKTLTRSSKDSIRLCSTQYTPL